MYALIFFAMAFLGREGLVRPVAVAAGAYVAAVLQDLIANYQTGYLRMMPSYPRIIVRVTILWLPVWLAVFSTGGIQSHELPIAVALSFGYAGMTALSARSERDRHSPPSLRYGQGTAEDDAAWYERQLIDGDPENVKVLNDGGVTLIRVGRFTEAIDLLERACVLTEWSFPIPLANLVAANLGAGHRERALELLDRCRQLPGLDPESEMELDLYDYAAFRVDDRVLADRIRESVRQGLRAPDMPYGHVIAIAERVDHPAVDEVRRLTEAMNTPVSDFMRWL